MSDAVGVDETAVFDAVTLRVAQKSTDLDSLKPTANATNANTTPVDSSPIDQLAWVFCFDNLLMDSINGGDANVRHFLLSFKIIKICAIGS